MKYCNICKGECVYHKFGKMHDNAKGFMQEMNSWKFLEENGWAIINHKRKEIGLTERGSFLVQCHQELEGDNIPFDMDIVEDWEDD